MFNMKPNSNLTSDQKRILKAIEDSLTVDMLKPELRKIRPSDACKVWGHCFLATEAAYYLFGGKKSGYSPRVLKYSNGNSHWWLVDDFGYVVDPTIEQVLQPFPYSNGKRKLFVANHTPSKRTQELIRIVEQVLKAG